MTSPLVRQIVAVTFFRLLLNTGRRFIYPFAPALSRGLDVPLAAITSIIATSQITSLLGLFTGPLADRIGYRFMMRTGLALLAGGMLLCGLLPSYWPVFIGLVVASFGKTVFDPAIQAFIGRNVPFTHRARVIGAVETAWAGSTLVGIPALGLILGHVGLSNSFFILAFLGSIGWISIVRVIPPDEPGTGSKQERVPLLSSLKQLLRVRPAAGMLAFGFWISIANDSLFVIYGAWFEQEFHVSLVALGFSTVAIGAAELTGESLTAMFGDRLGLKRAIISGLSLAICAYLLLPFIGRTLPLAMTGVFCVFLAFEFTMVTSFSLSTELMPRARATMMSGFYATSGIGRMTGVLIGGALWQFGGITAVAWTSAGFTVLGLLSLVWGLHGWRRHS
ncbi:MFS transporter [Desulfopila sp. IMCC35006]|uniref:MFS transporter n=1 Tax=Desulfopila sp. IMCC35006 TaxID=2569542 RepID=UPI0010ACD5A3|nr:MFS transporter [Desulfopila sp. IMCC35006]TKB24770.1 MFS transporter [Desulfopila sp. IMCC35006]